MTTRTLATLGFGLGLGLAGCGHPTPTDPPATPRPAAPTVATPAPAPGRVRVASPAPFAVQVTGHGPAMILIPGLASSGDVWASTVAHERDRFTCHVLTLAGFAGQPRVAAPMLPTVRDAIAAYITAAGLDHPIIVGHSLGGAIALDLAATRPELVGPLVVVDILPFLPAAFDPSATVETARAGAQRWRAAIVASPPDAFRDQQRGMLASMITDPANRETVLGWSLASDRSAVADALTELMTDDLRPRLAGVSARALVIGTWQGRPGSSREETQQIFASQYANLRGAEIVIADHARHFVMLDDPAFLFARMDAFLAPARPARR